MFSPGIRGLALATSLGLGAVPAARAQWAVIDVPATVQLIKQVATTEQQLQAARDQLLQVRQSYQAMTGGRGMEVLLGGMTRNYLPSSWSEMIAAMQGSGSGYSVLTAAVRRTLDANAILSAQIVSQMSPQDRTQLLAARRSAALRQAMAQEALANTSARFASMQTLIATIGSARDPKAVMDLQARIGAELGMLQNEQTKLELLQRSIEAQEALDRQVATEQLVAAQGRFDQRFQPVP